MEFEKQCGGILFFSMSLLRVDSFYFRFSSGLLYDTDAPGTDVVRLFSPKLTASCGGIFALGTQTSNKLVTWDGNKY